MLNLTFFPIIIMNFGEKTIRGIFDVLWDYSFQCTDYL